jgi:hypothetical protein
MRTKKEYHVKKACPAGLLALLLIVVMTSAGRAGEAGWEELNKKAQDLRSEQKYSDALKTYEKLLQLGKKSYGEKSVKVAEILIEMSLIERYDLNNEKKYDELQGEAKRIMMTLNGTLNCREPAKLTYEQCTERWSGQDPCVEFSDYRDYIKVTYYGLEGSAFKTPEDLIRELEFLFRKFETRDTVKIKDREAVRIKLREEFRQRPGYEGHYRTLEFRYEEFILLPMKQGFMAFNFTMTRSAPIPRIFSQEEAPEALYGDAYEMYQIWSSFLESCSVTDEGR